MFLNLGQDRGHGEDDTEQHVECDEELVQLALTHHVSGVVGVADDDGDQGEDVEDAGHCQQSVEPGGVIGLFVIFSPGLSPAVSEVNDQNQLNDDEHEASDHTKVHPGGSEVTVRNEEGSHPASDDQGVLESPESILNTSSRISGAADTDHDERHEEKEDSDDEADPVDSEVSHCILALDLAVDETNI